MEQQETGPRQSRSDEQCQDNPTNRALRLKAKVDSGKIAPPTINGHIVSSLSGVS
jgi:hypothetical protein